MPNKIDVLARISPQMAAVLAKEDELAGDANDTSAGFAQMRENYVAGRAWWNEGAPEIGPCGRRCGGRLLRRHRRAALLPLRNRRGRDGAGHRLRPRRRVRPRQLGHPRPHLPHLGEARRRAGGGRGLPAVPRRRSTPPPCARRRRWPRTCTRRGRPGASTATAWPLPATPAARTWAWPPRCICARRWRRRLREVPASVLRVVRPDRLFLHAASGRSVGRPHRGGLAVLPEPVRRGSRGPCGGALREPVFERPDP